MRSEYPVRTIADRAPESNIQQRRLDAAIKTGFIDSATINQLQRHGLRIDFRGFVKGRVLKAISSGDLSDGVVLDPDNGPRKEGFTNRARLAGLRIQLARIDDALDNGKNSRGEALTVPQTLRRMREANRLRAKISRYSLLAGEA